MLSLPAIPKLRLFLFYIYIHMYIYIPMPWHCVHHVWRKTRNVSDHELFLSFSHFSLSIILVLGFICLNFLVSELGSLSQMFSSKVYSSLPVPQCYQGCTCHKLPLLINDLRDSLRCLLIADFDNDKPTSSRVFLIGWLDFLHQEKNSAVIHSAVFQAFLCQWSQHWIPPFKQWTKLLIWLLLILLVPVR